MDKVCHATEDRVGIVMAVLDLGSTRFGFLGGTHSLHA